MNLGILSGVGGVLGEAMATGAGRAVTDGSLGAAMSQGAGRAVTDGSLGCTSCGSMSTMRGMGALGETAVAVPTTLILGALLGGAVVYWFLGKPEPRSA